MFASTAVTALAVLLLRGALAFQDKWKGYIGPDEVAVLLLLYAGVVAGVGAGAGLLFRSTLRGAAIGLAIYAALLICGFFIR